MIIIPSILHLINNNFSEREINISQMECWSGSFSKSNKARRKSMRNCDRYKIENMMVVCIIWSAIFRLLFAHRRKSTLTKLFVVYDKQQLKV